MTLNFIMLNKLWNNVTFVMGSELQNGLPVYTGALFSSLACFTLNCQKCSDKTSLWRSRVTCCLALAPLFGKVQCVRQKLVPKVTPLPQNMRPWARNICKMSLGGTNGPPKYSKLVDILSHMEDFGVIAQHWTQRNSIDTLNKSIERNTQTQALNYLKSWWENQAN